MKKYLSYREAMQYMGMKSYNTLYKAISRGLPVINVEGIKKIDCADIDSFMGKHKTSVKTSKAEVI